MAKRFTHVHRAPQSVIRCFDTGPRNQLLACTYATAFWMSGNCRTRRFLCHIAKKNAFPHLRGFFNKPYRCATAVSRQTRTSVGHKTNTGTGFRASLFQIKLFSLILLEHFLISIIIIIKDGEFCIRWYLQNSNGPGGLASRESLSLGTKLSPTAPNPREAPKAAISRLNF